MAAVEASAAGEEGRAAPLRFLLPGFLPRHLCKELEFIHRSCCAVGYRPGVLSTTLSHLVATSCAHFLLPFVPIRERLKEKVEEFFGCEFELFVEFTGLIRLTSSLSIGNSSARRVMNLVMDGRFPICDAVVTGLLLRRSWCKGGNIGWHSDDNRPYLKQRDFAAVCYLNNYEKDFKGGVFHFKDGEPSSIMPQAGDTVIYTADDQNIHSVDEVTDGERITLTLWFTRDSSHDEDAKIISLLSERLLKNNDASLGLCLPFPASDKMYWFTHQLSGFDIRWARLHILGYSLFPPLPEDKACNSSPDKACNSSSDSLEDPFEQLVRPLRLGRGGNIFNIEFTNILHALQVVQFYNWKASELQALRGEISTANRSIQPSLVERTSGSELVIPCDPLAAKVVFGHVSSDDNQLSFKWDDFALAIGMWEDYVHAMHEILMSSIPHWQTHQIIFPVSDTEQEN